MFLRCGFMFRVVKRTGYFVPKMGEPASQFPRKCFGRMRATLISGGEEFGYFGCPDQ